MEADEVIQIVTKLLDEQDQRGWTYTLGEPQHQSVKRKRRDRLSDEWTISIFWWNSQGSLLDGPGGVIVDNVTGKARFIESP